MADGEELTDMLKTIFSYNLISLFFVFTILLFYGIGKDYLLFGIYEVAQALQTMGSIGAWVVPFIETVANSADILPQLLDLFWLVGTIVLFVDLIIASYHAKREGWFSVLGFMTFGILFFMFIMGVFSTIGTWFETNFIIAIFGSVSYATPFLDYYLNHLFPINTGLTVLCIIANFIDLDFSSFNQRKTKEVDLNEVL